MRPGIAEAKRTSRLQRHQGKLCRKIDPPTNSKAAPVSEWLRMRQAIACPLNSMLPAFIPQADHLSSSRPEQPAQPLALPT